MMSDKTDFKKALPALYVPKNTDWQEVNVPAMQFLMIEGAGNPNSSEDYAAAVEALYSVAYPLKFLSKKTLGKEYVVPPLEGLWYANDMSVFEVGKKDAYKWTMMLMQPDWITNEMVQQAIDAARQKKPHVPHDKLRFEKYDEGRSLQLLHVGSYDDEAPRLYELHHTLMPSRSLDFNGHHHEIYLNDPRRVASGKLKTILRQPVK